MTRTLCGPGSETKGWAQERVSCACSGRRCTGRGVQRCELHLECLAEKCPSRRGPLVHLCWNAPHHTSHSLSPPSEVDRVEIVKRADGECSGASAPAPAPAATSAGATPAMGLLLPFLLVGLFALPAAILF